MLPVSLDCLRPVSCVPPCCQCLWIVFVLCPVYPMLPVSLDCLRPESCVLHAASVSRLSSSCVLYTPCCQCLWIVFVPCFVYPMLPVSLDCLRPVSCVPNAASVSGSPILDFHHRFSLTFIQILFLLSI